ncbi:MAG: hypothetical protein KDE27_00740, partial [Planctomycetes bacterium]|nr:hypothetical protein [Planctomycetota bacterium]
MRETSRRWLIRLAWAGLLVTGAMLVGIRVGRPVYYTDGARELAGRELAAAGMLLWQTPEVAFELPGPVEGRVAELPDGRLLYGRRTADGTTDLVVFDPQRPNVAPEPAYGLNTRDNELAPACGGDGAVYFASDRPADGAGGGYDLFRSTWTPRGFTRPVALELCNTAADETDPAPRPGGGAFVFVRIDPALRNGDNGTLYRCDLDSNLDPEPLFGAVAVRAALSRARTDRDPAFACDGGALWFVRKELAVPLRLMRVSLLGSELDEPVEVGDGWRLNRLRAPAPGADGATLGLLQSGRGAGEESTDLWFVSTAREVYPWWAGQRWLEWLLLGLFLTFLLLILLLHLGRRWTALDLLAQCLLLSLLLHLLLFLWLMGVEITGALLDGNQDGGSLEVTVLSASASDSAASGDGQRLASIAALVKFEPSERALDVAAPGAAVARAEN